MFKYKGYDCLQIPEEIMQLIQLMQKKNVKTVLQIGYYQGALHQLFKDFGFEVMSIDIRPNKIQNEHITELLINDSQAPFLKEVIKEYYGFWDTVYIDGSHRYEDCYNDCMFYRQRANKLIAVDDYNNFDVNMASTKALNEPNYTFISNDNPSPKWNGIAVWEIV